MDLTIDDLAPNPRNPRKIKNAARKGLNRSLEKFGDLSGITFNRATGQLVCGHQRLDELRRMGGEYRDGAIWVGSREYRVRVVDWDEAFEREANVAANNLFIQGEWDDGIEEYLREIQAGMSKEEFSELQFDDLAKSLKIDLNPIDDSDEGEIPEPPADPVTKPGDVWTLGDHRLICADGSDAKSLAALFGCNKAKLLMADPPYGVGYDGGSGKQWKRFQNDPKSRQAYQAFIVAVLSAYGEHCSDSCALYLWFSDSQAPAILASIDDCGWTRRAWIVWAKNTFSFSKATQHYRQQHEPCIYAGKSSKMPPWYGPNNERTVWEYDKPMKHDSHPTMKPVSMYGRCIKNSSSDDDIVAEIFLGSGTTIIAAEKLGRRCFGTELDPGYCDVIIQRWEQLTGGKAVRK